MLLLIRPWVAYRFAVHCGSCLAVVLQLFVGFLVNCFAFVLALMLPYVFASKTFYVVLLYFRVLVVICYSAAGWTV